jgi:hypothetical protein
MGMTGLAGHNGFMTYPRSHIVAEGESGSFHVVTRCVRRAFLCGHDQVTGQNYAANRTRHETALAQAEPEPPAKARRARVELFRGSLTRQVCRSHSGRQAGREAEAFEDMRRKCLASNTIGISLPG